MKERKFAHLEWLKFGTSTDVSAFKFRVVKKFLRNFARDLFRSLSNT